MKTFANDLFLLCLFPVLAYGSSFQVRGASGEMVWFDGQTAYAVAGEELAIPSQALTVSAWVKMPSTTTSQIFMNRGAAGGVFTFYLYSGKVRMLVCYKGTSYKYALAPAPRLNVWTHYAGTYDGREIRIYVNGELESTVSAVGEFSSSTQPLIIGALDARDRFFKGFMKDLRLWYRILNANEIAQVANGHSAPELDDNIAGHWTANGLAHSTWASEPPASLAAEKISRESIVINRKDSGYRGIWYYNQPSGDEYVYKYSGGLGTYCAKHIPFCWYVPEANKTFFTYGGTTEDSNTHLLHMVSYYDHETGMVPRPTILLDKQTGDAHDNPVINVDDKGHIWIFSSSHGTSRPSFISRSMQPYKIDKFEIVCGEAGDVNFSYPQPWFLPGQGFLFIHVYYGVGGRSIQMMTSPRGTAWSPRRMLSYIGVGHYQVSRAFGNKVGIAFNYHPTGLGLNYRTNLYYMESTDLGQTWKTVEGQTLKIPLSDVRNPALVHEYETEDPRLNVYMKDFAFDSSGNPVILYVTSLGYESGPDNMPRTWTTAHWDGAQWNRRGSIVSDNNYDTGALFIESESLWRIVGPTEVGPQPFNPGGEVAMWVSKDQGVTWQMQRLMTKSSPYNHTYVRGSVNTHPDFYALWADGHGRQPSDSRLYFCNKQGDVFRLPVAMEGEFEKPALVEIQQQ